MYNIIIGQSLVWQGCRQTLKQERSLQSFLVKLYKFMMSGIYFER